MKLSTFLFLCFAVFGACASDVGIGLTKQDVRAMAPGDRDYCADEGWYGDGVCDSFCLNADPDCGGCFTTGCSNEVCAREEVDSTCEVLPQYACYQEHGTCEAQAGGECGWTQTPELSACLNPAPEPAECRPTGCSGEVCSDEAVDSACVFLPEYACYAEHGECARQGTGECGWNDTMELNECLDDPTPEPDACRPTGCSGEICSDEAVDSACVFLPEYACYQAHGECARQDTGECGWNDTMELNECLDAGAPEPNCRATGCSGQICADQDLDSTCEFVPEYACYQEHGVCEVQADRTCGWTSTPELNMCLAEV